MTEYRNKISDLIVSEADLLADIKRLALKNWEDDRTDLPEHYENFEEYLASFKKAYLKNIEKV